MRVCLEKFDEKVMMIEREESLKEKTSRRFLICTEILVSFEIDI